MTYKEALKGLANSARPAPVNIIEDVDLEPKKKNVINPVENKAKAVENETNKAAIDRSPAKHTPHQLPGTLLRISVPKGTTINIFNIIEVASPGGISVVVRLPLLSTLSTTGFKNPTLVGVMDAIRAAGGSVEILN